MHTLSFSSEDERVSEFVQLPGSVLALLLNDKEDFRKDLYRTSIARIMNKLAMNHGQRFSAERCPSHRKLARVTRGP